VIVTAGLLSSEVFAWLFSSCWPSCRQLPVPAL
jgi:hypothetical protein